tara:strand:- start:4890 stop:5645 length:756 start_codon:yes stop_codon:yes gene_type:complete
MNDKDTILNSIFFPRSAYKDKDEKDHLIPVEESINIGTRFFLNDKNFPNILFFHGNAELSQEYDDIAEYYKSCKCNFIVADYRGYGLSSGLPNKNNLHSDANKIFNYVQNFLKDNNYNEKIIIMGRSLGSASACEIISNNEDSIDGCIIESGFGTELPLMNMFGIQASDIGYKPEDGFENLRKLISYSKPILIIHADRDDIIPIDEAKEMYNKVGSNKKDLWIIEGANHNNILMHTQINYFQRIKSFIDTI